MMELLRLWRSNEDLRKQLRALDRRRSHVVRFAAHPGASRGLAAAMLRVIEARRAEVLAKMTANRFAQDALLEPQLLGA